MPHGPTPTSNSSTTSLVAPSISVNVPWLLFVTHSEPFSSAMAHGPEPVTIDAIGVSSVVAVDEGRGPDVDSGVGEAGELTVARSVGLVAGVSSGASVGTAVVTIGG